MTDFHFVQDYNRHVQDLISKHPMDEAMSLAVGGHYEAIGRQMTEFLVNAGMKNGDRVVDLGCGSGRIASALSRRLHVMYLGTDVVEELLAYARTKCPTHYAFKNHPRLSIPVDTNSTDYVFAFSLFTHLKPEESFMYVRDAMRVLKPGGLLFFTYHDIGRKDHQEVFRINVRALDSDQKMPMNSFIHKEMIDFWCEETGFTRDPRPLMEGWQSSVLLRKPAA